MNTDYNKDNNTDHKDNNTDNKDNNVEKSKKKKVDNDDVKESQNMKKQLSDNGSISTKSTFEHMQSNSDSESQIL